MNRRPHAEHLENRQLLASDVWAYAPTSDVPPDVETYNSAIVTMERVHGMQELTDGASDNGRQVLFSPSDADGGATQGRLSQPADPPCDPDPTSGDVTSGHMSAVVRTKSDPPAIPVAEPVQTLGSSGQSLEQIQRDDHERAFDDLMELIQSTVRPESFARSGDSGVVDGFEHHLSLIVHSTQEVHEQIGDLLHELRRLQDLQVALEARFIRVSDSIRESVRSDFGLRLHDARSIAVGSILPTLEAQTSILTTSTITDRMSGGGFYITLMTPYDWVDLDQDGRAETFRIGRPIDRRVVEQHQDLDGDGRYEWALFNPDGDADWDSALHDSNGDGLYDRSWNDANGDGVIQDDEWTRIPPPVPRFGIPGVPNDTSTAPEWHSAVDQVFSGHLTGHATDFEVQRSDEQEESSVGELALPLELDASRIAEELGGHGGGPDQPQAGGAPAARKPECTEGCDTNSDLPDSEENDSSSLEFELSTPQESAATSNNTEHNEPANWTEYTSSGETLRATDDAGSVEIEAASQYPEAADTNAAATEEAEERRAEGPMWAEAVDTLSPARQFPQEWLTSSFDRSKNGDDGPPPSENMRDVLDDGEHVLEFPPDPSRFNRAELLDGKVPILFPGGCAKTPPEWSVEEHVDDQGNNVLKFYDDNRRLAETWVHGSDALGNSVLRIYDDSDQLLETWTIGRTGRPIALERYSKNAIRVYSYKDGVVQETRHTVREENKTTETVYGGWDRLLHVKVTDPEGAIIEHSTYVYDDDGNLTTITTVDKDGNTLREWRKTDDGYRLTTFRADGSKRSEERPLGDGTSLITFRKNGTPRSEEEYRHDKTRRKKTIYHADKTKTVVEFESDGTTVEGNPKRYSRQGRRIK